MERPPLPKEPRGRKDDKETGWLGVEGSKRKPPKMQRKEGGRSEEELHPPVASKQAFLHLGAFGAVTGGQAALAGASCLQVLAGCTGSGVCPREGKPAGLAVEARGPVLSAVVCRAGESRAQPHGPGQAQFPPTRRILSCAWETHLARILMPWARSAELSAQWMVPGGNKPLG